MGLILKGTPHPKFITIFPYDDMDPILTLESFQASPTKPPRGHDPSVQPELVVLAETLQKELHTMGIEGWFFTLTHLRHFKWHVTLKQIQIWQILRSRILWSKMVEFAGF